MDRFFEELKVHQFAQCCIEPEQGQQSGGKCGDKGFIVLSYRHGIKVYSPLGQKMSLFFYQEIFFLEAVIPDMVTAVTQVIEHAFDGTSAAAEPCCCIIDSTKPALPDQFQDIFQPFLI
ncbi:hypothetical protein LJ707_02230 [Mucilaginibacter sp. UR6-1]|nr:hypothetical protein [Mucilaginibacter sp. UR6-1]MCC8407729.1 hypothetical protein [Mucilaginibacter sp. UR6-1]